MKYITLNYILVLNTLNAHVHIQDMRIQPDLVILFSTKVHTQFYTLHHNHTAHFPHYTLPAEHTRRYSHTQ